MTVSLDQGLQPRILQWMAGSEPNKRGKKQRNRPDTGEKLANITLSVYCTAAQG